MKSREDGGGAEWYRGQRFKYREVYAVCVCVVVSGEFTSVGLWRVDCAYGRPLTRLGRVLAALGRARGKGRF